MNQLTNRLKNKKLFAGAFAFILVFVLGCGGEDTVARIDLNDNTAFSVNGQKISAEEFRKKLYKSRYVQEAQGARYQGPADSEMYLQLREYTINVMTKEVIIMQEAEKVGVAVTNEEVENVIQSIKSNFPTEEEFKATMLSRGLDEETMKNYNRMQLTGAALMQKLGSEQKYNELLSEATSNAKIIKNDKVIVEIINEVSKISSEEILSDPGKAI